jgi:hypothetical protein
MDRMHTVAILQDPSSKMLLQAGETDQIDYSDPSFIVGPSKPVEKLLLYPNPVSGPSLAVKDAEEEISIFSAEGRLVKRYPVMTAQSNSLDISILNEGIYIVRSGVKMERLVVIK